MWTNLSKINGKIDVEKTRFFHQKTFKKGVKIDAKLKNLRNVVFQKNVVFRYKNSIFWRSRLQHFSKNHIKIQCKILIFILNNFWRIMLQNDEKVMFFGVNFGLIFREFFDKKTDRKSMQKSMSKNAFFSSKKRQKRCQNRCEIKELAKWCFSKKRCFSL